MPEVVTHARLQVLELPAEGGRFALVTLDNGLNRPATMGPLGLGELSETLDAALAAGVVGIGITGVGKVFCAGAELSIFASLTSRAEALEFAQQGHRVLGRLSELSVPTFAFISGAAVGGGLELALNCTYRTVAAQTGPLGLPEVGLGIIPGWGGAWLLPNLAGADRAVEVIIEAAMNGGRTFTGSDLAAWDDACVTFESGDFLDQSLAWASQVVRGEIVVKPTAVDRDEQRWQAAIDRGRALVDARVHGATPAPYRALDLLSGARTATREEGFLAEDGALADLVMTDECRASLYAFTLTRSRARQPAGAPAPAAAHPIRTIGVVGAGLMASQLAMLMCTKLNVPVVLTDIDQQRVDKGLAWIRDQASSLQGKGRLSADDAARVVSLISGSVDKAAFGNADLVIEAVFEDIDVKLAMLTELEPLLREDCLIATNTSSLSLEQMAAVLKHPDRFVGMHFFNPVARMALLEIIPSVATDDVTLATAFVVGKQLGKSCVLVQDAPGFVVNRLLTRMYTELMAAIDEGTPLLVADGALDPLGLPMSPFTLLGLIGPAVQLHVSETLAASWPDRFPVSPNLAAIVASGARTVFARDEPNAVSPEVAAVLTQGDLPSDAASVLARIRDALADEAWRMLDEGVVGHPEDLDTAMLLGAGWPTHLGGITPWLDRTGGTTPERRFLAPGAASVGPASHDVS
jgi:3-hydroxyacyl-CoA dehydrogenase/enoyl-CoA hydratase/carnithine racemase